MEEESYDEETKKAKKGDKQKDGTKVEEEPVDVSTMI